MKAQHRHSVALAKMAVLSDDLQDTHKQILGIQTTVGGEHIRMRLLEVPAFRRVAKLRS